MTRTLLAARWIVGHEDGRHVLLEDGEVVFEANRIVFVGHSFPGEVQHRRDYGTALIAPGFIDLDALGDLDTTILGYDNHPAWRKGRVWPQSYVDRGPVEMYDPTELAFQKRYAFAQLLRNGITTALPIASLFYREWGETAEEFGAAATCAIEFGLRVYLGNAYRTGKLVLGSDGTIGVSYDEQRGLDGLSAAEAFCRTHEGTDGGLVRTMLAPDRIETCSETLLRRTAAAADALDVPVRLHCCQSRLGYEMVVARTGHSPPEWLAQLELLSPRALLPHGTWVSGSRGVGRPGQDLALLREGGATVVHCPIVSARGGRALDSFGSYRRMGIRVGLGTDTWPPDMVANMQVGAMLRRVMEGDPAAASAADLFDAATLGGADALGRPDLGRLKPGALADLAVFDLSHDRIGQVIDPVQTLMVGGSGRDVRDVVVDGRFVVVDGSVPGVDMAADHARAQAQFDRLVTRYPERTFGHPPASDIFRPSYEMRSHREGKLS